MSILSHQRFYLEYNNGHDYANTCQFGKKVASKSGSPLLHTRNGDKHACIVESFFTRCRDGTKREAYTCSYVLVLQRMVYIG